VGAGAAAGAFGGAGWEDAPGVVPVTGGAG
jgi:hypothetical protein